MKLPSPDHVKGKLQTVATLAGVGIIRPQRPDRLLGAARALLRWGATPAAGYKAAATRYPDDLALIDESGTLTFKEVHERSNALAHALAAEGVGPGSRVAIMCRNHRGWVEAYVAAEQARRQRAVPQHRLLRAAARGRRPARGPGRDDLRRGVRRACWRRRRRAASASSPGTSPTRTAAPTARSTSSSRAATRRTSRRRPSRARRSSSPRARRARRRARAAASRSRSTRSRRCSSRSRCAPASAR